MDEAHSVTTAQPWRPVATIALYPQYAQPDTQTGELLAASFQRRHSTHPFTVHAHTHVSVCWNPPGLVERSESRSGSTIGHL